MPKVRKLKDLGPIHRLLLTACPPQLRDEKGKLYPHKDGTQSIAILAELLGMSAWGVNLWIKRKRIPGARAKEIIALPGCQTDIEEFIPYIF